MTQDQAKKIARLICKEHEQKFHIPELECLISAITQAIVRAYELGENKVLKKTNKNTI